jgi:hypothetical protein
MTESPTAVTRPTTRPAAGGWSGGTAQEGDGNGVVPVGCVTPSPVVDVLVVVVVGCRLRAGARVVVVGCVDTGVAELGGTEGAVVETWMAPPDPQPAAKRAAATRAARMGARREERADLMRSGHFRSPEAVSGRDLLQHVIMRAMCAAQNPAAGSGAGQRPGPPLWRKLGVREGSVVSLLEAPEGFDLGELPAGATIRRGSRSKTDLTVWFVRSCSALERRIAFMAPRGANSGLWIAWPKRTSPLASDLSDVVVRRAAIAHGLVDFKVCAIDSDWSGLRFNKRKEAT